VRVLHLIDSLDASGGAEQSLASLAGQHVAMGLEVDVAYLVDRPGLHARLKAAGCEVFSLAGRGGRAGWIARARRLISDRRPDLVHTTLFESDIVGRVAATLTGIPVVSTLASAAYGPEHLDDPSLSRSKVRAAQLADAATARLARRFHAITLHVAEVMSRRLLIKPNRIDVVPRGRDPNELGKRSEGRRSTTRRSLGLGPDDPMILAAARHEYPKGLDTLLHAVPRVLRDVPKARVIFAGREGRLTPRMREIIRRKRLDDVVTLLGHRKDIPDLLSASDVLVAPSRREGLGGILLEAMALEAPIVASDLPPFREIVDDGTSARFVPPGDPIRLGAVIVESILDRTSAEDRARRARARFLAHFTIERVAAGMMTFYERALSGRSQPGLGPYALCDE
jgi:glycosyltransferase involved in cell wall biosynthesis